QGRLDADPAVAQVQARTAAEAGATWWVESWWDPTTTTPESLLERVRQGPPSLRRPPRPGTAPRHRRTNRRADDAAQRRHTGSAGRAAPVSATARGTASPLVEPGIRRQAAPARSRPSAGAWPGGSSGATRRASPRRR